MTVRIEIDEGVEKARQTQAEAAVLERSAENVAEDANEVRSAAWDGLVQGLAECTQS